MRRGPVILVCLAAWTAWSVQAPVDPPGVSALIRHALDSDPVLLDVQARAETAPEGSAERLRPRVEVARLKAEVRNAYADAWLAHQQLRLNLQLLQLVAEMESVTQADVETGMATGSDLLKAKAESLMFTEQRMDHLQSAVAAREALTRLAGPEAESLPPYPQRLDFTFSLEREDCLAFALAHAPDLAIRQATVARLRTEGGSEADIRSAEAAVESLRRQRLAEVATALGRLNTLRHHLSLHREHLLPLRERTVQTLREEVEAGRRGLMDVINARRMELDERELDIRHQAEALKAAAELDRLAGGAWILDGEE